MIILSWYNIKCPPWFNTERVCSNLHGVLCSVTFIHIQLCVTFTKVHLLPKANRRRAASGCKAWTLAKFTWRPSCAFFCRVTGLHAWRSVSHVAPQSVWMQGALNFPQNKQINERNINAPPQLGEVTITVKQCVNKVFQETIVKPLWCWVGSD